MIPNVAEQSSGNSHRLEKVLAPLTHPAAGWVMVLVGAALRLRRYLQDRGVMHDEAQLAVNILTKSFAQLFRPLNLGDQAAPVGFLLLQKIATIVFGSSEPAIRLVPLLAALIALPTFLQLVRKIGTPMIALLAISWFALDEHLIYYAAEGKQYSTDVLCCLIVLTLALRGGKEFNRPILAIAGAILIWFSHPVLFVKGGIATAMMLEDLADRDWKLAGKDAGYSAIWIASFLLNFLFVSRYYAASSYLRDYWADRNAFAPIPPLSKADLLWYPNTLAGLFTHPISISPGNGKWFALSLLAGTLFLFGCAILRRHNRRAFHITVSTLLLCLLASSIGKYPFADRLLLFAVPLLILPLAFMIGAENLYPLVRALVIGLMFIYPVYLAGKYAIHPPILYDVKPAIRYVKSNWQSGDRLYLHWGSNVLGSYYLNTQPEFRIDDAAPISGSFEDVPEMRQTHYEQELDSLRGRVWFVFSMGNSERPLFEQILNHRGRLIQQQIYNGGAADLYDLTQVPQ
jgi:hypothetical protein